MNSKNTATKSCKQFCFGKTLKANKNCTDILEGSIKILWTGFYGRVATTRIREEDVFTHNGMRCHLAVTLRVWSHVTLY